MLWSCGAVGLWDCGAFGPCCGAVGPAAAWGCGSNAASDGQASRGQWGSGRRSCLAMKVGISAGVVPRPLPLVQPASVSLGGLSRVSSLTKAASWQYFLVKVGKPVRTVVFLNGVASRLVSSINQGYTWGLFCSRQPTICGKH